MNCKLSNDRCEQVHQTEMQAYEHQAALQAEWGVFVLSTPTADQYIQVFINIVSLSGE